MNNRNSFKNSTYQEEFDKTGFIVIDLLSPEEVEQCRDVYLKSDKEEEGKRYNTLEVNDYENRKSVFDGLLPILDKPIRSILDSYKFVGFNFAVKKSQGTNFPSHLDGAHAFPAYRGVNVWIPLIDVNGENGALYIVKKSHLLPIPIRGIGLPYAFEQFEPLVQQIAEKFTLKTGQAIFFDDRMIHGSPSNKSDVDRPAIIAGLIPEEAEPIIYIRHNELKGDTVELFEAPVEMLFRLEIGKRPAGFKSFGVFPYEPVQLTEKEFLSILSHP